MMVHNRVAAARSGRPAEQISFPAVGRDRFDPWMDEWQRDSDILLFDWPRVTEDSDSFDCSGSVRPRSSMSMESTFGSSDIDPDADRQPETVFDDTLNIVAEFSSRPSGVAASVFRAAKERIPPPVFFKSCA